MHGLGFYIPASVAFSASTFSAFTFSAFTFSAFTFSVSILHSRLLHSCSCYILRLLHLLDVTRITHELAGIVLWIDMQPSCYFTSGRFELENISVIQALLSL